MEVNLKLSKSEVEYILIDYYQARGLEPDIKLNKDFTVDVTVDWDIERFEEKF